MGTPGAWGKIDNNSCYFSSTCILGALFSCAMYCQDGSKEIEKIIHLLMNLIEK